MSACSSVSLLRMENVASSAMRDGINPSQSILRRVDVHYVNETKESVHYWNNWGGGEATPGGLFERNQTDEVLKCEE